MFRKIYASYMSSLRDEQVILNRLYGDYQEYKDKIQIQICSFDGNIRINENQRLSSYILRGTRLIINDIPFNHHVLSVGYPKNKGNDLQIACTGTVAFNESPWESAQREMQEELGIRVCECHKMLLPTYVVLEDTRKIFHYIIPVNFCRPVTKPESKQEYVNKRDGKDKVAIYIYGTDDALLSLVKNIKYKIKGGEVTAYIGIVNIQLIKKWINYVDSKNMTKRYFVINAIK